jgi:hypothetical protein
MSAEGRFVCPFGGGKVAGVELGGESPGIRRGGTVEPAPCMRARLDGCTVLLSNDLGALQGVAQGLTAEDRSNAAIPFRDSTTVGGHEEWAYRRYRHNTTLDRNAAGLSNVTPTPDVLMFCLNGERKSGVLRLLASDDSTTDRLNGSVEPALAWPPLQASGPALRRRPSHSRAMTRQVSARSSSSDCLVLPASCSADHRGSSTTTSSSLYWNFPRL